MKITIKPHRPPVMMSQLKRGDWFTPLERPDEPKLLIAQDEVGNPTVYDLKTRTVGQVMVYPPTAVVRPLRMVSAEFEPEEPAE